MDVRSGDPLTPPGEKHTSGGAPIRRACRLPSGHFEGEPWWDMREIGSGDSSVMPKPTMTTVAPGRGAISGAVWRT